MLKTAQNKLIANVVDKRKSAKNSNPEQSLVKRTSYSASRFKLPSEIERWAYSNETNEEVRLGFDPEDFESIDDSYLDKFDQDPNEKKIIFNRLEQKQKIINVLKQCKSRKDLKQKNKDDDFNDIISNIISANSNSTIQEVESLKKNQSNMKIVDQDQDQEKQQQHSSEEDESKEEKKAKKLIKRKESSKKFSTVNSGISRAMPGSLQQNITIERNFFKDLLKLSKQRYISKLNTEFQKKRFVNIQTRKGLFKENEPNLNRYF